MYPICRFYTDLFGMYDKGTSVVYALRSRMNHIVNIKYWKTEIYSNEFIATLWTVYCLEYFDFPIVDVHQVTHHHIWGFPPSMRYYVAIFF